MPNAGEKTKEPNAEEQEFINKLAESKSSCPHLWYRLAYAALTNHLQELGVPATEITLTEAQGTTFLNYQSTSVKAFCPHHVAQQRFTSFSRQTEYIVGS